jgi:hypothetical protein
MDTFGVVSKIIIIAGSSTNEPDRDWVAPNAPVISYGKNELALIGRAPSADRFIDYVSGSTGENV